VSEKAEHDSEHEQTVDTFSRFLDAIHSYRQRREI
jgi:hypothetical protein